MEEAAPATDDTTVIPWVLSARSAEALREQAANLAELLGADASLSVPDIGWSLATTRSVFEHRAVVVGHDRDTLLPGLTALATRQPHPTLVQGTTIPTGPGPGPRLPRSGFAVARDGRRTPRQLTGVRHAGSPNASKPSHPTSTGH